jgi:hypothetical protein
MDLNLNKMKKILLGLLTISLVSFLVYSCTKNQEIDYKTEISKVTIPKSDLTVTPRKVDLFKLAKMGGTDLAVGYGAAGLWGIPIVGPYAWLWATAGSSFAAARCCGGGMPSNTNLTGYIAIDLDRLNEKVKISSRIENPYEYLGKNHNTVLNLLASSDNIFDKDGYISNETLEKIKNSTAKDLDVKLLYSSVLEHNKAISDVLKISVNNHYYYNQNSFQEKLTNNEKSLLVESMKYLESVENNLTISNVTEYIDKLESITLINPSLTDSERNSNLKYLAGLNYSIAYWITQNEQ